MSTWTNIVTSGCSSSRLHSIITFQASPAIRQPQCVAVGVLQALVPGVPHLARALDLTWGHFTPEPLRIIFCEVEMMAISAGRQRELGNIVLVQLLAVRPSPELGLQPGLGRVPPEAVESIDAGGSTAHGVHAQYGHRVVALKRQGVWRVPSTIPAAWPPLTTWRSRFKSRDVDLDRQPAAGGVENTR